MPGTNSQPDDHADRRTHHEAARDERTGGSAAAARVRFQSQWVEQQLRIAQERGDFDNLPGIGKPIEDLGGEHDPDWWLKKLVEREHITGVLPPALSIRKDDAELDARLDAITAEADVRREVEDFNARVLTARIQPVGGPPMITQPRDVDTEVEAWSERRAARIERQRIAAEATPERPSIRRGIFRRRS
jgi:hypothetical protein